MPCSKEQIASCLRGERARLGWSRERLSHETGIPVATIGTYEKGENRITLENAWKFADVFKKPIGELFGRDERKFVKATN